MVLKYQTIFDTNILDLIVQLIANKLSLEFCKKKIWKNLKKNLIKFLKK